MRLPLPAPRKPPPPGNGDVDETAAPRTIGLGGHTISYRLQRANRQTIGFTIDRQGLRVRAPQRASLAEIESALLRHGQWITRKIAESQSTSSAAPLLIADGMRLPLLGQEILVRLARGNNRLLWSAPLAPEPSLTLCLRSSDAAPTALEQALRARARELFTERLSFYSALLGVTPPRLSLSAARTRWGSCSQRSGIRLHWRLIHFPLAIIDYVVAHELAHLREMNHSTRFWSIVAQLYPDYRNSRAELRRLAAACPHW